MKEAPTNEMLYDLTPQGEARNNEARLANTAAIQDQQAETAANLAAMVKAYQTGGKKALLALLREKAKTAKPRKPLEARRD